MNDKCNDSRLPYDVTICHQTPAKRSGTKKLLHRLQSNCMIRRSLDFSQSGVIDNLTVLHAVTSDSFK
jgi:hypothetical protein